MHELGKLFEILATTSATDITPEKQLARLTLSNVVKPEVHRRSSTLTVAPNSPTQERKNFKQSLDAPIEEESVMTQSPTEEKAEATAGLAGDSGMPSTEAISTLIQDSSSEPPSMMTGSERMQMTPVEPSSHESGGDTAMSDAGSSHTAVDEVQSQVGQVDDVPPIEGTELKLSSSNDSLQVNLDGAATPTKAPIGILQRHNLPLTPPPDYEAVSMQPPPIPPRPAQKDEATEQIEAWTEQQDVREVMENIIHQLRWAVKSEGKALDNEQIDAITRWVVFYLSLIHI